jgi:hypothetical protein
MVLLYALALAKEAKQFRGNPSDPWLEYDCVVGGVRGHTLVINTGASEYPVSPTANQFYLWTIEFLTGELQGFTTVVTGSTTNTLSLATGFFPNSLSPAIGDTFRLNKGPMGKAEIYMLEPSTKTDAVDGFYLTIAPTGNSSRFTTLNANTKNSSVPASKILKTMKFDILGELPFGIPNDLGVDPERRVNTFLYLYAEQLEIFVHGFANRGDNGLLNVVSIDVEYLVRNTVGTRKPTQAAALSFEFEVR